MATSNLDPTAVVLGQRDALEAKAQLALEALEGEDEWTRGDTRELAELALSVVHNERLKDNYQRTSFGDRVGSAIGYALLAVVTVVLAGVAVWVVRSVWSAALS